MSMYSTMVYGYGFEINTVTNEQIYKFMKNHKDTIKMIGDDELLNFINKPDITPDDIANMDDTFIDFENEYYGEDGLYSIISNIMSIETNINFGYFKGTDGCIGEMSICLQDAQPWQYNKTEKELTQEKLDDILTKYKTELGLDVPIEHLCIEYFG